MKHTVRITLILLGLFLFAQFIGLGVIYNYVDVAKTQETGEVTFEQLPIGERPEVNEQTSYLPIILVILIGTALLLLLLRYKLTWVWKGWFLIAIVVALTVSFASVLPSLIAFILALILGVWKIFKPGLLIQTGTELFIYGGLAAIFVPIFNLFSVSILIVLIALYDAYAVWKSKHMVKLAKEQTKAKIFAGLLVPYTIKKRKRRTKGKRSKRKISKKSIRTAILGGGDIGFPLIFAGVVLKEIGLWQSFVIPFFAALGLAYIMWKGEEKKFYPAMPFIGAGCFIGFGVVYLLGLLM